MNSIITNKLIFLLYNLNIEFITIIIAILATILLHLFIVKSSTPYNNILGGPYHVFASNKLRSVLVNIHPL